MDKRKSILNVSVSIGFKLVTMIVAILVKRLLINICGNDVNGLNALYISIIGFLSVAELGVGSAITFCMYKPIVEDNKDTVSALYHLFRRIYLIIGGIIFAGGLAVMPFIHIFAKDYTRLDINLAFTFFLMLVSVVITYLFSCKTSLINAYKNNYITTSISSGGILFQYILQIIVLLVTRSFVWYLICRIVVAILQWIATDAVASKKYSPILLNKKRELQPPVKKELLKNIKAMFMHRIGYTLVNTIDSVTISTFVGVVALGAYSNYSVILVSMTEVLRLVFTSLTSVIGHLYVESSKESTRKYCEAFHLLNFVLGVVFFLGYYAVINNLIAILFSADLILTNSISLVITINGFVQFMRQTTLMFREATGTFYNDRWKPLCEGVANLILSVLFVQWFGIAGVIIATIITNLLVCHVVEPYVLYKHAFKASPKQYYFRNYSMITLFTGALITLSYCMQEYVNEWTELLVNGFLSVGISVCVCFVVVLFNINLSKELLVKLKSSVKNNK